MMNWRFWPALTALMTGAMETGAGGDVCGDIRREMVETQIRNEGISDPRVLAAMEKVPRHEFVPPHLQHLAYRDGPLPIGHGQTISQPYIVALMTGLLHLAPGSRVLEIGTGSGYQAAILAELAADVYTVEIVEPLATRARETFQRLGYRNIHARTGDGYQGWPDAAPFDAIIVTCAPEEVPPKLVGQLREGGRLVVPVGREGGVQQLFILEKIGGEIQQQSVIPVRFVPMIREAS